LISDAISSSGGWAGAVGGLIAIEPFTRPALLSNVTGQFRDLKSSTKLDASSRQCSPLQLIKTSLGVKLRSLDFSFDISSGLSGSQSPADSRSTFA
jgi:hypothetical protein